MPEKKQTRYERQKQALDNVKLAKWCYVNTENEFVFMNHKFVIPATVEAYEVKNKAYEVEDYTNEASMEQILVTTHKDGGVFFYDEDYNLVKDVLIRMGEN